jgi:hypothetical protein
LFGALAAIALLQSKAVYFCNNYHPPQVHSAWNSAYNF